MTESLDFRNLPEAVLEKKAYDVALVIRKYQDFKIDIAMDKLDPALAKGTRKNYIRAGVTYIKTGKKAPCLPKAICNALDKVMAQCVQPLTPSESDKKRAYKRNYTKKDNLPPVARMEIIKKPLSVKVSYGVKIEDSVKCFNTYDESLGFLKGLRFMGNKLAKMVSFEALEEVKEEL